MMIFPETTWPFPMCIVPPVITIFFDWAGEGCMVSCENNGNETKHIAIYNIFFM
jgi:hypothetical protein